MIPTLQSFRFIFVMMIFMSHFAYQGVNAFDAGGDCGVAFFFILSGFVLSLGYGPRINDGSFCYRRFLSRRLKKLYPLHLLCLLFFLGASHAAIDLRVVLNALLLQCWVPDSDYYFACNSVSWFLSCILFCYAVFPWAYRHTSTSMLAVMLLLCGVVYVLLPYRLVNAVLYVHPLLRFVDFFLGIMLCRLYQSMPRRAIPNWTEVLLVLLLVATLAVYPYTDAKLRTAPLYWLVLLPLIWVFAKGDGPVSRLLSWKPLQWLGSLSMPIFLTHQMIIGILQRRLPDMPVAVMLTICILAVILVSWCIDRFFLRQIARLG